MKQQAEEIDLIQTISSMKLLPWIIRLPRWSYNSG
jgi:hypothetical protein